MYLDKKLKEKLSDNFSSHEFHCKCKNAECTYTVIHSKVVEQLEKVRQEVGLPLKITSAYRCEAHNKKVGGVANSQHVLGGAVDISAKTIDRFRLGDIARKHFKFVKIYDTFVHMDLRLESAAVDD